MHGVVRYSAHTKCPNKSLHAIRASFFGGMASVGIVSVGLFMARLRELVR